MRWLFRKAMAGVAAIAVLALAGVGAVTVLEYVYRETGLIQEAGKNLRLELTMFWYSPYVVSVIQPGLVLGRSNHLLESRFEHGPCDLADGTTARFNSRGYRGPEFDGLPPKKTNEARIIVTGGSAAMSFNVGEACTLDRRLQAVLSEALPEKQVKVFNLANAGWISFQQLVAVELLAPEIQPDIVISFSGNNDLHHAMYNGVNGSVSAGHMRDAFGAYRRHIEARPDDFLDQFHILKLAREAARSWSGTPQPTPTRKDYPERAGKPEPGHLLTRLHWPLDLEAIAARTDFEPFNGQVVDNFIRNERLMARVLAADGAHLISALQPLLYLRTAPTAAELDLVKNNYHAHVNFVVQGYRRARDGLKALAETEKNVTFVDLSMTLAGEKERMLTDNVHMTAAGYKLLAEELGRAVVAILTGPKSGK